MPGKRRRTGLAPTKGEKEMNRATRPFATVLVGLLVAISTLLGNGAAAADDLDITYEAHVQTIGWTGWITGPDTAGTTGRSLRLEALRVQAAGVPVVGRGHVQSLGWQPAHSLYEGDVIGTVGSGLRLEAFELWIDSPKIAAKYSIQYRAHVQSIGWQSWAADGQTAGTTGRGLRVEAVQIRLVSKG